MNLDRLAVRRFTRITLYSFAVFAFAAAAARWYGGDAAGDDTFIYVRYVSNALNGHGYTFNRGEPSFGITSPLWAAVMTPIAYIFGQTLSVWRGASTAAFSLSVAMLFAFALTLGVSTRRAILVAAFAALEPHSFRWASSGMENGLVAILLVSTAICDQAVRKTDSNASRVFLGACCGLLPFARPELAFVSATLLLLHRDRRVWLSASLISAGALAWTYTAFGAVLPETAAAKGVALRSLERFYAAKETLGIVLTGSGVALALLVRVPASHRSPYRLAALVTVICTFGYLGIMDHLVSTRYASYLCGPVVIATALYFTGRERIGRWVTVAVASHLLIGMAVLGYFFPATRVTETRDIQTIASRVRAATPEHARIAMTEVGGVGLFADRYVIDLVGLVDRASLAWLLQHGRPRDQDVLEALLIQRRADYYIDTYAQRSVLVGHRIRLVPILEGAVERNNLSWRRLTVDTWRLYRVEPLAEPSGPATR